MRLSKRHRWFRRLALVLTVAAVAALPAQATTQGSEPEFPTWTVSWVEPAQHGLPEFPTWIVNWAQPGAPESSPAARSTGFDYGDAGIGASIALGATLLAAAGYWARHRGRRPTSPV